MKNYQALRQEQVLTTKHMWILIAVGALTSFVSSIIIIKEVRKWQ